MNRSIIPPTVILSAEANALLSSFRQSGNMPESGGVLIGLVFPETNEIKIMHATKPNPEDEQRRFSFVRSAKCATKIARRYWEDSGGIMHYVGEWHSHPQSNPKPSITDRITMGVLYRKATVVSGGLVLIIVGVDSIWVGFWSSQGHTQITLQIEPDTEKMRT